MLLDTGLVFLSDSRTNAGVDQISTFRKTTVFQKPGDRVLVLQSSGNLAITQTVVSLLKEAIERGAKPSLMTVPTLLEPRVASARRCGAASPRRRRSRSSAWTSTRASRSAGRSRARRRASSASLGRQLHRGDRRHELFQIGESKYGKPIIDRVLRRTSSLNEAVKCALVSMDSTIRSNLSVGLPLDLVIVKRDRFNVARHLSIDSENDYFRGIRGRWSEALREAFVRLPDPDWLSAVARDTTD
jgi:putative proteasome-type protease